MKKHKFNIFPEAKPEDYARLLDDIRSNGYDRKQPITLYQGDILDGWNRQKACDECGTVPTYTSFDGNDLEAVMFVMRSNKRRNLSSGQWAAIAVDAEDTIKTISKAVERQRRDSISTARSAETTQKIVPSQKPKNETAHKAAELFNTNRTYVNQANTLKKTAPETFEKLKAGKISMQDAQREVRKKPTDDWREDERKRQGRVADGETVLANYEKDKNLIAWAESKGLAVPIDRSSAYGNPFLLGPDGDRDAVCDAFQKHYLPYKPSITTKLNTLKGKVLCCHCYPDRCHGAALIAAMK